jgi:hypothetical protein
MKISQATKDRFSNAREMDVKDFLNNFFMKHNGTVWSWGARNYTNLQNKGFAFTASGNHFKGNVSITINGLDLFDIDFCNNRGNQTTKTPASIENVYIDNLIDVIDGVIEKIPAYKR